AHADALGVGVRDHLLLADRHRHDLLLGDAAGLAARDLDLLANRLVAAHVDRARLADLDLLAHRHRALLLHDARAPDLDGLGLRARSAAGLGGARVAAIAAALVLLQAAEQRTGAVAEARAARNFLALPVALVNALGAHLSDLLGDAAFLHDRLLGH